MLSINIEFIDSIVRADLPDQSESELHELVNRYQSHCHSRSCRKYKNIQCRFRYGRYFTDHTICAEPLSKEISENDKVTILNERPKLLRKVKSYIDKYLDPHRATFKPKESISEILSYLEISEEDYYLALSIATGSRF